MIAHYLASLEGIEIVGMVLLLVSLASFLAAAIWAVRADHRYVATMARLPLESADNIPEQPDEAES